jgi:hypothetical protein
VIVEKANAWGDPKLLRLVIENLLENAWKYTGKNPNAVVEFGCIEQDEAIYYVRDNGVGFDMSYVDRLFKPFQRLHSASDFEGTGIGLATVRRAVNRQGGDIWPESEVGKGTVFYFTIR